MKWHAVTALKRASERARSHTRRRRGACPRTQTHDKVVNGSTKQKNAQLDVIILRGVFTVLVHAKVAKWRNGAEWHVASDSRLQTLLNIFGTRRPKKKKKKRGGRRIFAEHLSIQQKSERSQQPTESKSFTSIRAAMHINANRMKWGQI